MSANQPTTSAKILTRDIKPGMVFGRWTVIGMPFKVWPENGNRFWRWYVEARCQCGTESVVLAETLARGLSRSCGCLRVEVSTAKGTRHGAYKTRLYSVWQRMRMRCNRISDPDYENYGGRGIRVCPEWDERFENFRDWALANGYRDDLTIERKDVNRGYEPGNCCFIPMAEQSKNRRTVWKIEAFGEAKSLDEWGRDPRCAVCVNTFSKRIINGWPPEEALMLPGINGKRFHSKEHPVDSEGREA